MHLEVLSFVCLNELAKKKKDDIAGHQIWLTGLLISRSCIQQRDSFTLGKVYLLSPFSFTISSLFTSSQGDKRYFVPNFLDSHKVQF